MIYRIVTQNFSMVWYCEVGINSHQVYFYHLICLFVKEKQKDRDMPPQLGAARQKEAKGLMFALMSDSVQSSLLSRLKSEATTAARLSRPISFRGCGSLECISN